MRAIDTNVLVRLIARDDPSQLTAASRFVEKGAWVSLPVLVETVWVLTSVYDASSSDVVTTVGMLLNHESLTVQDPDTVASALKVFRKHRALGFADCLMLELARRSGHLPFGTFDRALGRLSGAERL